MISGILGRSRGALKYADAASKNRPMTGSSGSWHETSACTCTSIARTLDRSIMRHTEFHRPLSSDQHLGACLSRRFDLRCPVAPDRYVPPRLYRRPRADERQPALEARELGHTDTGPLVARYPRPQCHVRNRVLPRDVLVTRKLPVEHPEQARHLALIALDHRLDFLREVAEEHVRLPHHRTDPGHLEHEPLKHAAAAVHVPGQELTGLLGQINQDGAGLEHDETVVIERRNAAVGG